jgi:F-type H+-transporting ATPase subunit delta
MRETRIGNRYAKALFELALEQNILDKVENDIGLINQVISESRDFRLMLKSPIIHSDKKEAVIRSLFKNKIETITLHFLLLITRKRREAYIEPITREFIKLYKKYKNIITTWLQTAVKIDSQIRQEVVELIAKQTGGEVELNEEVKEYLIGGFVLKYQDYQYDASISRQLADLRKDFNVNLYERKI